MTPKNDPEIDRVEVAALLGVTVRHTYNLQKSGRLSKGKKISLRGDRRWLLSEVETLKATIAAELADD